MRRTSTSVALAAVALIAGAPIAAQGLDLKLELLGQGGEVSPGFGISETFNIGDDYLVGTLEEKKGQPLEVSLVYIHPVGNRGYSVNLLGEVGYDGEFRPKYYVPGLFAGKQTGNVNVSLGGTLYFDAESMDFSPSAVLRAEYKDKNIIITSLNIVPLENPEFSSTQLSIGVPIGD